MALTADRATPLKDAHLIPAPIAAGVKIFGGSIVMANAAGYATPGATANNFTWLGIADAGVDNSAGVNGAKQVLVRRRKAGKFVNLATDALTQADLGKTVYVVDDQTVAKTSGGNTRSAGGVLVQFEADGVWIV